MIILIIYSKTKLFLYVLQKGCGGSFTIPGKNKKWWNWGLLKSDVLQECADNTGGHHCGDCAEGFYGNPDLGGCRPCPCPSIEQNFALRCDVRQGHEPYCVCKPGYTGKLCDRWVLMSQTCATHNSLLILINYLIINYYYECNNQLVTNHNLFILLNVNRF